jgi:uncharacterized protein (TIGR03435 family)
MNSAGYDIEAKAEGNPGRSQIWLMLQSLLEDRFTLKVHRETKELPVYMLTAVQSGLKLRKPKEADCTSVNAAPLPSGKDEPPPGPCFDPTVTFDISSGLAVRGRQVAMAEFARVLSTIDLLTMRSRSESPALRGEVILANRQTPRAARLSWLPYSNNSD